MAKQKGGRKLGRSAKHKGMYQAQVFRTARNKAAAQTRIARRKKENPNPNKDWRRQRWKQKRSKQ